MVAYLLMFPVISIGPFSISSYGIFLALGFLLGVFLVWRLSRAWDLSEEKVLDLTLLTFLGGFIGARAYFILENFSFFGGDLLKWLLVYKYPGFSLWGAILGGVLTLKFFSKKFKINFWQAADFAIVGLLVGLIFLQIGCFLGGCNIGIPSNLFFATNMIGAVGKRFPVQLVEVVLLLFVLSRSWKTATHFHIQGTVAARALIYIGVVMLITQPLRQNYSVSTTVFNSSLVILGTVIFYNITKRKIISDIKSLGIFLINLAKDPSLRKILIDRINKSWYNYVIGIRWKARLFLKILRKSDFLRRLNVYFSHKDSKYY